MNSGQQVHFSRRRLNVVCRCLPCTPARNGAVHQSINTPPPFSPRMPSTTCVPGMNADMSSTPAAMSGAAGLTKAQRKNQKRRHQKAKAKDDVPHVPPPLPSASWVPESEQYVLASCDGLSRFPPPEVANAIALKRIQKEKLTLKTSPVAGIIIVSQSPEIFHDRYYRGSIAGPMQSPYERGVFDFEMFLPASYPMKPPKVRMLTKIYHPNIDKLGRICLDTLKGKWSPGKLCMCAICFTIITMLLLLPA